MSSGNVKGSIMTEVVKYLRSRGPEAREAVPEHLRQYLDRRILATSWYPEEDYLEMARVIADLIPAKYKVGGLTGFELCGRATAGKHVEGSYRPLIGSNPARTLRNFPGLWKLRHDTGRIDVELTGETSALVELHDFTLVDAEACEAIQGSFWGFLTHSGAADPRFEHTRCRARGDSVCEWRVDWSE